MLFEQNPQPMLVFSREDLKLLEANRAASDYYGYSPKEFQRMQVTDLFATDDRQRFEGALAGGNCPQRNIWHNVTMTGHVVDTEMSAQVIDYLGRPAILCVLEDMAERRSLEEQLRQSQKMEAVGMLAGGVAHDFNNLLTIIMGYSQLLLNGMPQDNADRYSVERIIQAGQRAAALTRQLLAFSRRQVLQPRVLELNKLVCDMSNMLQRLIGEDVELRLDLHQDVGRVNADASQLEQVIMNLAVNSRDAMPKGGTLTLATTNVTLGDDYTARHLSVAPGKYIRLSVSDTGHGMDETTRARLFEPFFTTKPKGKGTGLGLSIVFGIVKQSGGSLEVFSQPGRGASIDIYLPRVDRPAATEAEASVPATTRGSETVLLVEDEDMVRALVRDTLLQQGYTVLEASGPAEARRISDSFRGHIHVLITDMVMPKESGRELATMLQAQRPHTRVLYMSGYTDHAVVTGMSASEAHFLQKPFSPETLTRKVREVLEHSEVAGRAGM